MNTERRAFLAAVEADLVGENISRSGARTLGRKAAAVAATLFAGPASAG